jgi:hypothetical protein
MPETWQSQVSHVAMWHGRHGKEWQVAPAEFPVGYTIRYDILKSLFSFHHLELLHLDTTCTFSLNDRELVQLGDTWLKLHSLDLGTQNGWRQPSYNNQYG